jgi:hypothetical protein
MDELTELAKTYGPAAPYSEHKRGEHITYTSAEGERRSGEIVWVQAAFQDIPFKYVVAPDDGGFLDFALPSDIITQGEQEQALVRCVWCGQMHPADQVNQCPFNPY